MKYIISTLGCKVNQYETQAMETMLLEHGHEPAATGEIADAVIINTCAVTAESGRKSRQTIRRLRDENPGAVIAVCGCYSQLDPDAVAKTGADVIFGSNDHAGMVAALENALGTGEHSTSIDEPFKRRVFEQLPAGAVAGRTRAMLKIQDGCVNFCTYCIIPYTRGPVRSAPLADALAQARELAEMGYREIVVTGIEIASWGADLPGKPPVKDLIAGLCEAVPELRIRLGSLEPRIVTEDFCRALAGFPNLCPQFHLSMQSGCDTVLQRMRRKYDTRRYYESVCLLRKFFPNCAITTDMIVAFPGETEAEFEESLAFIQKCAFADMHIFPYSRRPGTPADTMPGQLGNAVKEDRSRRAIAVAQQLSRSYRESLIGTTQAVLFEEQVLSFYTGHAPNYVRVYAAGEELHNVVKNVKITGLYEDGVFGLIEA